ncbi:flagellar basal body P-ring formation chaperone FlgA [Cupriavidus sp. CuC1]|uniref:flagellar basal body P-ring formation chaperone FlgA n=1 Tax=Cupriavidus sp. CuC1 TaxID=3373131 RepID=UPI0037D83BBF
MNPRFRAAAARALLCVLAAGGTLPGGAGVEQTSPFPEDPVRAAVEQFLERQTAGLPGKASIQVVPPSGGRAPDCPLPEPFLPPGASPWGRVSVGVRCAGERPWTRYVQARVSVVADYYVAGRNLMPGEAIDAADMEVRQGDLASLPRAVVTDPAQVTGAVAANRIAAGSPMRTDLLKKAIAVRQGQNVTVLVEGDSFQLSSEGKVMAEAAVGNNVQVRLKSGQVVNALVRSGDTVVLQQ